MKRKIIVSMFCLCLFFPTISNAEELMFRYYDTWADAYTVPHFTKASFEKLDSVEGEDLQNIKKKSSLLIKERINAINAINDSNNISMSNLMVLSEKKKTKIKELKQHQISIEEATTLEDVKALYYKIGTEFRLYEVFIPKLNLEYKLYRTSRTLNLVLERNVPLIEKEIAKSKKTLTSVESKEVIELWENSFNKTKNDLKRDATDINNWISELDKVTASSSYEQIQNNIVSVWSNFRELDKLRKMPKHSQDISGSYWKIKEIKNGDIVVFAKETNKSVLRFQDIKKQNLQYVRADLPCEKNSGHGFDGLYKMNISKKTLSISSMYGKDGGASFMQSKRVCSKEINDFNKAYVEALKNIKSYNVISTASGTTLTLTGSTSVMTFVKK